MTASLKFSWQEVILTWFALNSIIYCFPQIYLFVLPFAPLIVSCFLLSICLLKGANVPKRFCGEIVFVFVFISILTLIGGKNLRLIFTIYSSLVAFYCFDGLYFSKNQRKFLEFVSLAVWLFLVVRSINYHVYYSSNVGYINSNTMAMTLINLSMLIICLSYRYRHISWSVFVCIVVIFTFIALIGYRARGCTIAYLFFTVCLIIKDTLFKKHKRVIYGALFVLLCGFIVPFVYIYVVNHGYFDRSIVSNKDMFTRVRVWKDVVYFFCMNKSAFLYGLSTDMLELRGSALHSNYLELLAYCGLGGFVAYSGMVIRYVNRILLNNNGYRSSVHILIIAFAALMVLGYTEVSMFWAMTYVHNYMFLGIASGKHIYKLNALRIKRLMATV